MTKRIEVEIYAHAHNGLMPDGKRIRVVPGQRYKATEKEFKVFKDRMRIPTADAIAVEEDDVDIEKLRAEADELGIKYATNTGVQTLRKKVDEALEKVEDTDGAE